MVLLWRLVQPMYVFVEYYAKSIQSVPTCHNLSIVPATYYITRYVGCDRLYGWMRAWAWRGREKPPRVLRHFLQLQFNHEENHNKPVPVPEKEPSKRLQKPTPFLPYAVLRGLACQEGANRVLQKQNNRPVPANATRQGDRTKVRIGQFGGHPPRPS